MFCQCSLGNFIPFREYYYPKGCKYLTLFQAFCYWKLSKDLEVKHRCFSTPSNLYQKYNRMEKCYLKLLFLQKVSKIWNKYRTIHTNDFKETVPVLFSFRAWWNEDTKSSLKCNTARSQLNYKSIQIEKLFLTDVSKSWHSINLPLHIWEWTKFSTKAPPVLVGWDPKICYALSNFNNAASSLPNSIPLQLPLLITHNSVWRHFNYFKTAQIDEAFLRQKCYALWQKNLNPLSLILFLLHAS